MHGYDLAYNSTFETNSVYCKLQLSLSSAIIASRYDRTDTLVRIDGQTCSARPQGFMLMAEKSSVEWHRSQLDPNDPRCLSSAA